MTLRPISRQDLESWVAEGWLSHEAAERIRARLQAQGPAHAETGEGARGFNLLTLGYYLGALLILSALGWFLVDQWNDLGPSGLLLVGGFYAVLFGYAGHFLRFRSAYPVGGGILFTCAVWMVPLMTYAIESWAGFWPVENPGAYHGYYVWINGSWIVMEWATILVGLVVLRRVRFPFVTFPIAFALWFFSMDLAGILMRTNDLDWTVRSWCSVVVGALMIIVAFTLDHRYEEDLSFWIYLFGLCAFWGGLTSMDSGEELAKAYYAVISLGLGFAGLYLQRSVFAVFATMGILAYLGHLAHEVFRNSVLFPFVVATLGLGIIIGAVYLQRHRRSFDSFLNRYRPARLRQAA